MVIPSLQAPTNFQHIAKTSLCDTEPPTSRIYTESFNSTKPLRALKAGFGRDPIVMREGGSIPIVNDFKKILGVDTLLLGLAFTATVPAKVGAKWTHLDSNQVVHEDTRDFQLTGEQVHDFEITNPDAWPTGRYKVEVMVDGNVVQSREFAVR